MSITIFSPDGITLLTVIGALICLNSSFASVVGLIMPLGCLINKGAPKDICNVLALIILVTSNLVNLSFGHNGIKSPFFII